MSVLKVRNLGKQERCGQGGTRLVEIEDECLEPGNVRLLRPHVLPGTVPVATDFHRLLVVWSRSAKSRNLGFIL